MNKRIYKRFLAALLTVLLMLDLATFLRLGVQALQLKETVPAGGEPEQPAATEELPALSWTGAPCTEAQIDQILSQMDLREKVYQLFIVTPEQLLGSSTPVTAVDEALRQVQQQSPVGGVVFFQNNLINAEQTRALLSELQSASPLGLFLSVDEEGGTVSRLASNPEMGLVEFDSMNQIGASGNLGLAYQAGYTIGRGIKDLGFNLDFAPVADIYSNPQNQVVKDRAFSSDPAAAAQMVSAVVRGFQNGGMICTLKHFPGHGGTTEDSHAGPAILDKSLEELESCEFLPFRAGIETGAPVVMVGHITCPQIDSSNLPASLSSRMVSEILRGQLGFEGLVVTDSLQMEAIASVYASGDAAVQAFSAGCDLLLMPNDLQAAAQALLDAVNSGRISQERLDQSVRRIIRTKIEYGIIPANAG